MKKIISLIAVLAVLRTVAIAGRESHEPFSSLEKTARSQWGGWLGDQRALYREFRIERDRLGTSFEAELLKFLGRDITKHEKVSAFLLEGGPEQKDSLPELSLLVMQQGLTLCDAEQPRAEYQVVSLSVRAAVLSHEIGLQALSVSHKDRAERLMRANPKLAGAFPSLPEDAAKIYESIPTEHDQASQ